MRKKQKELSSAFYLRLLRAQAAAALAIVQGVSVLLPRMLKRALLPEQRSVSKGAHAEVSRRRVEWSISKVEIPIFIGMTGITLRGSDYLDRSVILNLFQDLFSTLGIKKR